MSDAIKPDLLGGVEEVRAMDWWLVPCTWWLANLGWHLVGFLQRSCHRQTERLERHQFLHEKVAVPLVNEPCISNAHVDDVPKQGHVPAP